MPHDRAVRPPPLPRDGAPRHRRGSDRLRARVRDGAADGRSAHHRYAAGRRRRALDRRGNGDGHIAVSAGSGDCWTVDWVDGLHQTKVSIAAINRAWTGLDYAGWATNYGGVFALDVADATRATAAPAGLPSLRLSRFLDSRSEIDEPRDVKQHPLTVATAEHALRTLGFDPGPIDGHYGTATDEAVKAFQKSLDDPMDGQLGPRQWAKLAHRSKQFIPVA